ncbi:MAG: ATPase, partial [Myxococcaceae bacterium]|nr:ATPase [Myxococcaceae bacterium]
MYRAMFEHSPVALLLADDQRRYVEANPAACRLLGVERSHLLGMRIDDVLPLAGAEGSIELQWSAFLRDGTQAAEIELRKADGQVRTVSFSAQAHVQPGLHLSVLHDVSEQRESERQINRERDRLYEEAERGRERVTRLQTVTAALARARTLVEVSQVIVNEGCVAFDAQRGVVGLVVVAGTAMEIVKVRSAKFETASSGQLFLLTDSTPMTDAIRTLEPQIYGNAEALAAQFPVLFQTHWSRYGALLALPLSLHRQALGALSLSYNGERKINEEDRRDLAAFARLCAWAVERARLFDVAQTERRRAEEANRVKDEFLGVVSHELRTPLHAMLGWATLARSGKLEPEALERALKTIERNAHAQAKLVEDLLDVTRITTGKLQLNIEPTCPRKVVEAALDVVRPAADAKGVRLELFAEPVRDGFVGDADRLQQIV